MKTLRATLLSAAVLALMFIPAAAFAQYPPGVSPPVFIVPAQFINGSGVANCPQGIATTSTDCLILQNTTASTAGVPEQMSTRFRLTGTARNSTSGLSETNSFFIEHLPATVAGTITGTLKTGYIAPNGTVTYPMYVASNGAAGFGRIPTSNATLTLGYINTATIRLTHPAEQPYASIDANTISGYGGNFVVKTQATGGNNTDRLTTRLTISETGVATFAGAVIPAQPQVTAGTHATVVNAGELRTVVYKATVTATTCLAPFAAAALTADCVVATLPAKTKIIAVYADTTAGWTCSGTCTGTKVLVLGKSAGGVEYIASNTVATNPVTRGTVDAELGTELVAAARIQGGAVVNWSGTTTVTARFTSGTGNWGDAATTFVDAGSTTFYIETTVYP